MHHPTPTAALTRRLASLLPPGAYLSFILTTGDGSSLFWRFTSSSTACSMGSGLNFVFRHSVAVPSKAASRAFCCSYTEPVCMICGACGEEGRRSRGGQDQLRSVGLEQHPCSRRG